MGPMLGAACCLSRLPCDVITDGCVLMALYSLLLSATSFIITCNMPTPSMSQEKSWHKMLPDAPFWILVSPVSVLQE